MLMNLLEICNVTAEIFLANRLQFHCSGGKPDCLQTLSMATSPVQNERSPVISTVSSIGHVSISIIESTFNDLFIFFKFKI